MAVRQHSETLHVHTDGAHDDHHGFSHVASKKVLLGTFSALIFLTFITVAATSIDLGPKLNLVLAMVIATIKAGLVCAFFMHLIYDKLIHSVAFLGALLFAILFVSFTLMDSTQYQQDVIWEDQNATAASQ